MTDNPLKVQLKETSQLTGARCAAWLAHNVEWELLSSYQLNATCRAAILALVKKPYMQELFNEGKYDRSRSRLILQAMGVEGNKLYMFPDPMTQRVILVGAETLSGVAQRVWKVVAHGNPSRSFLDPSIDPILTAADLEIPYHLPEALDRILELLLRNAACETGWLAIRSGDYFEIRAQRKCSEPFAGRIDIGDTRVSIEANPLLRDMIRTCQPRIIERDSLDWAMVPRVGYSDSNRIWAAIPLLIGKRLIGLWALWPVESISEDQWSRLSQLAQRMAPSVEASITFSDLTNQLHRMALLNDFAVTITSALDPEQIAQRMFGYAVLAEEVHARIYQMALEAADLAAGR